MSFDILKMLEAAESKAMDTATAGEGQEFVPTELARELIEKVRLENKIYALFQEIPMPSNPYELPIEGADAVPYLVAESTGEDGTGQNRATASTPGTGKIVLTAKKIMTRVFFSAEEEEDSIIPVAEYVKRKIARAISNGLEQALLDGDTAGSHQDSDVTAADDRRKAWAGLRKLALANAATKIDLSTFNITNLRAMRKAMKKYGVNPNDLAWLVGPSGYNKMLDLDEVKTVDKYGEKATVLNGELARLDGIPIIVSEHVRENLNASGVYDGTTTTKTYCALVNRDRFITGARGLVKVKAYEVEDYDQTKVINRIRRAFKPIETPSATDPTVVIGYNITA
jgi:HK97 family phage major capsid protein